MADTNRTRSAPLPPSEHHSALPVGTRLRGDPIRQGDAQFGLASGTEVVLSDSVSNPDALRLGYSVLSTPAEPESLATVLAMHGELPQHTRIETTLIFTTTTGTATIG